MMQKWQKPPRAPSPTVSVSVCHKQVLGSCPGCVCDHNLYGGLSHCLKRERSVGVSALCKVSSMYSCQRVNLELSFETDASL